jgi:hypothetical protein
MGQSEEIKNKALAAPDGLKTLRSDPLKSFTPGALAARTVMGRSSVFHQ